MKKVPCSLSSSTCAKIVCETLMIILAALSVPFTVTFHSSLSFFLLSFFLSFWRSFCFIFSMFIFQAPFCFCFSWSLFLFLADLFVTLSLLNQFTYLSVFLCVLAVCLCFCLSLSRIHSVMFIWGWWWLINLSVFHYVWPVPLCFFFIFKSSAP